MSNLLLPILFYSSFGASNKYLKTSEANIRQYVSVITTCTKTSSYTTEPIDYVCEKTGQHFIISHSGSCTIEAETCLLAQKMAMDCAIFSAKAAADAEIAQLDQGCKTGSVE